MNSQMSQRKELSNSLKERLKRCGRYHPSPKATLVTWQQGQGQILISPLNQQTSTDLDTSDLEFKEDKHVACNDENRNQANIPPAKKQCLESIIKSTSIEISSKHPSKLSEMYGTPVIERSRSKLKVKGSKLNFSEPESTISSDKSKKSLEIGREKCPLADTMHSGQTFHSYDVERKNYTSSFNKVSVKDGTMKSSMDKCCFPGNNGDGTKTASNIISPSIGYEGSRSRNVEYDRDMIYGDLKKVNICTGQNLTLTGADDNCGDKMINKESLLNNTWASSDGKRETTKEAASGDSVKWSDSGNNKNTSENESVLKARLMKEIAEKDEELRQLQMVKRYRTKNNLVELQSLIDKWRDVSQQALQNLCDGLPEPKPTLTEVVSHLGIDHSIIHFDALNDETFY